MNGIDKIVDKIMEQSQSECDEILSKAALEVKNIIATARAKAAKQSEEIIAQAEAAASKTNAVAKSTAESITRNRYLEIKNAILNDIISAAYLEIDKFSDEKYFDMIKKLLLKNVMSGECQMHFNGFDLGRLPNDFETEINMAICDKGAVHISDTPVDIENGFILVYSDVEINCSLKSVFDENMERLKDMLNIALF